MKNLLLVLAAVLICGSVEAKKKKDVVVEGKLFSEIMTTELSKEDLKKTYVVDVTISGIDIVHRPNKFAFHTAFNCSEADGTPVEWNHCFISKRNDPDKLMHKLNIGDKVRITGRVYMAKYMLTLKMPCFEIDKIEKL